MSELDEIRERRMRELQEQKQQFDAAESVIKQLLTKDALVRFGTIKAAYPDKARQVISILAHLAQQGRIREQLSDAQFKELLRELDTKKKDITIRRI